MYDKMNLLQFLVDLFEKTKDKEIKCGLSHIVMRYYYDIAYDNEAQQLYALRITKTAYDYYNTCISKRLNNRAK